MPVKCTACGRSQRAKHGSISPVKDGKLSQIAITAVLQRMKREAQKRENIIN